MRSSISLTLVSAGARIVRTTEELPASTGATGPVATQRWAIAGWGDWVGVVVTARLQAASSRRPRMSQLTGVRCRCRGPTCIRIAPGNLSASSVDVFRIENSRGIGLVKGTGSLLAVISRGEAQRGRDTKRALEQAVSDGSLPVRRAAQRRIEYSRRQCQHGSEAGARERRVARRAREHARSGDTAMQRSIPAAR